MHWKESDRQAAVTIVDFMLNEYFHIYALKKSDRQAAVTIVDFMLNEYFDIYALKRKAP